MSKAPERIWAYAGTFRMWRNHKTDSPHTQIEYVRADRIEKLEANLAKAVEALQWLKAEIEDHGFSGEGPMLSKCSTTLAEITGENHE